MTENEKSLIHRNFLQAKDRANQIIIEADLHLCKPNDIKKILAERGEDVSQFKFSRSHIGYYEPKLRTTGFNGNPVMENKALELYNNGYDDKQIADALGFSIMTISKWRQTKKLKTHKTIKREEETRKRYEKIMELTKQGYKSKHIAKKLGLDNKTIENIKSKMKKANIV